MPFPHEAYEGATLAKLLEAGLALLPPGRAFTRRLTGMIPKVLEALLIELARVHKEASEVLAHISPRRARREDFLRAWEKAAGTAPTGTPIERAQRVADAIRAGGRAMTLADYQAAANALGFEIIASPWTHPLFEAGASAAGDPARGPHWRYALTFPVAGGPSSEWPLLEQAWGALKRGHTIVWAGYATDQVQVIDADGNAVVDADGNRVVI